MKYWRKSLRQEDTQLERYQIHVIADRCKGCRECIEFCPRHVLYESADFNSKGYHTVCADSDNDCVNCGLCTLICPEFAITVSPVNKEKVHE